MYELLIVSKIGESEDLLSRVEKALKGANALELKTDKLGKKILAYPIKKQTEAEYTLLTFAAEGNAIKDVTDLLRLEQEALLRYLILTKKTRKLRKKVSKKTDKAESVTEEKKPKVTVVTKTKSKETSGEKAIAAEPKASKGKATKEKKAVAGSKKESKKTRK